MSDEFDKRPNHLQNEEFTLPITDRLTLLTGTIHPQLAKDVGTILETEVLEPIVIFPDRERRATVTHSLRRKDVFIIHPVSLPDPNAAFMELCIMIDTAKRRGADYVTAVIPYPGYTRGDRDEPPGTSITFRLLCDLLETAGVDRIVTGDLHAEQEKGFSRKPWDIVWASEVLIKPIRELGLQNICVVAPDLGAIKGARAWTKLLGIEKEYAGVDKRRDPITLETKSLSLIGTVAGYNVLLYDDETVTAESLVDGANMCLRNGALPNGIYAAVAHGKLSETALQRITDSPITRLLITDSIPQGEAVRNHSKIIVVPYAPAFAKEILRIHREG